MKHLALTIAPDRQRRLLVMGLAMVVGWAVVSWLAGPDLLMLQALEDDVAQLHTRVQAGVQTTQQRPLPPDPMPGDARTTVLVTDGPGVHERAQLWPWLQHRLQVQGLHVLMLQPQAMTTARGLPEQVVTVRLQGRWSDWLAFEQALDEHAPWWLTEQWQVLPVGQGAGQVRIEWQGRAGLMPQGEAVSSAAVRVWPTWPVPEHPGVHEVHPFPPAASKAPMAHEETVAGAGHAQPRQPPLQALRLLGIWRQGDKAHAVVVTGTQQLSVSAGQRVGPEGYRVRRVGEHGLELVAPNAAEPVRHLTLQGDPR